MKKFYPTIYRKSIYEIDYQKLKQRGICCLIFDLDNTILILDKNKPEKKTIKLFKELSKDFKIVIISNNVTKRVRPIAEELNCDYVSFALKPLSIGYRKIKKKYRLKKEQLAMIGDQLITDIRVGNKMTACTVLVDPLGEKDLKITSFNRFLERKIFKYFEKKNRIKKGVYYE